MSVGPFDQCLICKSYYPPGLEDFENNTFICEKCGAFGQQGQERWESDWLCIHGNTNQEACLECPEFLSSLGIKQWSSVRLPTEWWHKEGFGLDTEEEK